jgi:sec-independent protein translocase protein TatA
MMGSKLIIQIFLLLVASTQAFAPIAPQTFRSVSQTTQSSCNSLLLPLQRVVPPPRQRYSVGTIRTNLFGLGAPEIAVILIAAAFLLGPQKLAELGKDAGKIAGELKEVPKEFQEGLKEGERAAAQIKKKDQETVLDAEKEESSSK